MTRIAIYPGSFDPVTLGHEDIIRRSLHLMDKVIVAVAVNNTKEPLFTLEERVDMLQTVLKGEPRIEITALDGLLAEFARTRKATVVIRGLRAVSDFDYESQMALMNRQLYPQLETVFLVPALHLTYLSSSLVREIARLHGDVSTLVHPAVGAALKRRLGP
ncbi:MAG: pantetheine-phosphate adenylyltransferase [Gemmatimonadota bacterium]|nr:pantetheine-phosphate adenylyltransferase [Gemmatimonadota bacterium]MDH3366803.1 pantetheine-phosphate adenylyltransferase [Gemmatimonadota bacterium]MDH3478686.1 pantetheine-phosphate adenylyltransferase [Gemmatimonadota bacterium]MDH3569037.1 pantetheine-phosphate adenylyltransferase [Gemmatimonadota bacterium]MDH5548628.1 pantetheine-phosphate adenylyltransferase [Gemmatimonadota bacterium]